MTCVARQPAQLLVKRTFDFLRTHFKKEDAEGWNNAARPDPLWSQLRLCSRKCVCLAPKSLQQRRAHVAYLGDWTLEIFLSCEDSSWPEKETKECWRRSLVEPCRKPEGRRAERLGQHRCFGLWTHSGCQKPKNQGWCLDECVQGQARACANAHVSALVSTGVSEGFHM